VVLGWLGLGLLYTSFAMCSMCRTCSIKLLGGDIAAAAAAAAAAAGWLAWGC
jgi:hypothetical protein